MKYHPFSEPFPMLPEAELQSLAQGIEMEGQKVPICLFDGQILDGRNRFLACKIAGVEPRFEEYKGINPLGHVIELNLKRRHMNESQRAMVAARLANMTQGRPKKPEEEKGANLHLFHTREESSRYGAKHIPVKIEPAKVTVEVAAKLLNVSERSVKAAKAVIEKSPEKAKEIDAGVRRLGSAHVAANSGENEWYTPAEFIESARIVLGNIDLDPASSEAANEVVKATRFFTKEHDGLKQKWKGRVWLNPPYASDLIGRFAEKISASYEDRDATEALALVNNATETQWFQRMALASTGICFPSSRIKFWAPNRVAAPLQGQAILYFGNKWPAFAKEFRRYGVVCKVS